MNTNQLRAVLSCLLAVAMAAECKAQAVAGAPRSYAVNPQFGARLPASRIYGSESKVLYRHVVGPEGYGFIVHPMRELVPGHYYYWESAVGTSQAGYSAPDGSHWKLLEAAGIVEVDDVGGYHLISSNSWGHPYQYVWQITGDRIRRTAWIARDASTKTVSVVYQRPANAASKGFYEAQIVLENHARIIGLKWVNTPPWASDLKIVTASRTPQLPPGIFRATIERYLPATTAEAEVARRAVSGMGTVRHVPARLPQGGIQADFSMLR